MTAHAARVDDEKVGAQGIEFWTSLAEEELAKQRKGIPIKAYIHHSCSDLVGLLIECIQRVNIEDEDEDDDELGVALSSGCCLNAISALIGDEILDQVIGFVSNNILNLNWKLRYSSLLALGAITEGPDRMKFMNLIMPGLANLI